MKRVKSLALLFVLSITQFGYSQESVLVPLWKSQGYFCGYALRGWIPRTPFPRVKFNAQETIKTYKKILVWRKTHPSVVPYDLPLELSRQSLELLGTLDADLRVNGDSGEDVVLFRKLSTQIFERVNQDNMINQKAVFGAAIAYLNAINPYKPKLPLWRVTPPFKKTSSR